MVDEGERSQRKGEAAAATAPGKYSGRATAAFMSNEFLAAGVCMHSAFEARGTTSSSDSIGEDMTLLVSALAGLAAAVGDEPCRQVILCILLLWLSNANVLPGQRVRAP